MAVQPSASYSLTIRTETSNRPGTLGLVATAIGLAVAIPAVATFNAFQRRIRAIAAQTDALSRVLLAHLEAA